MFYALPNTALYLSLFLQIEVLFRYTTALLAWLCLLLPVIFTTHQFFKKGYYYV